jgi:hypothetical protein
MIARTIAGEPPAGKVVDLGFHLCPRASTRPGSATAAPRAGKPAGGEREAKARKLGGKEARG